MSVLWVICGAGRGVGKTTLANRLCEVLPDCVRAKSGHGEAKADGPGNFFTTAEQLESFVDASRAHYKHIVVECNSWAREGRGDFVIFIDTAGGHTQPRDDIDRLRAQADIRICPNPSPAEWRRCLRRPLDSDSLCTEIIEILLSQQRHLFGGRPTARTKVWFDVGGRRVFGAGLAHLLENIDRFGTLHDAAKAATMSYRYAWGLLGDAEEHLGKTLVLRQAGGPRGGKSALSPDGRKLLNAFRQLNQDVAAFADREFAALCSGDDCDG